MESELEVITFLVTKSVVLNLCVLTPLGGLHDSQGSQIRYPAISDFIL